MTACLFTQRLLDVRNHTVLEIAGIGNQAISKVTGPGALYYWE